MNTQKYQERASTIGLAAGLDPHSVATLAESSWIDIQTAKGPVSGVLHPVEQTHAAVVMVGGAGGGIYGPAGIYEPLAMRLQTEGVTSLRLEYRHPNYLPECVYDVLAAIEALTQRGVERVILIGWSFGGAVVISAGVASAAVVGVATIATQTYGAGDVARLAPKSLLLIHGAADEILPARLSREMYRRAHEPKELVLYPDDGHGIDRHAASLLEKLDTWSKELLLTDDQT